MPVRKKEKKVSFDAMVKFFLHHYNIPTRKDVDKLALKIESLEKTIKTTSTKGAAARSKRGNRTKSSETALDQVFNVVKRSRKGVSFADIQAKTGFEDKKIRNVIFRLNKLGKISRKSRGVYTASS